MFDDSSAKVSSPSVNEDAMIGRAMMRRAINAPYLEREQEHDLACRWKETQDQDALNQIAASHMRLVISLAGKFRRFQLPMSDLVQEGYVGLLEAASRFDPEREVRFSTYATWWIRAAIQDYILRNWSIVRGGTSSAQKALFFNLRRLRAEIMKDNENISKRELCSRIAERIGVSKSDVELMDHRLSGIDNSLSVSANSDEENASTTRMDFLVDDAPLQDEVVAENIDCEKRTQLLKKAMTVLDPRELDIIRARRLDEDGVTLEALGGQLGISKERVRQIEARALKKLRVSLSQYYDSLI